MTASRRGTMAGPPLSAAGEFAGANTAPSVQPVRPNLKARIHRASIAKLGPELYKQDGEDLSDRVYRAVNEEAARSTRTPLTREEHSNHAAADRRHPRTNRAATRL